MGNKPSQPSAASARESTPVAAEGVIATTVTVSDAARSVEDQAATCEWIQLRNRNLPDGLIPHLSVQEFRYFFLGAGQGHARVRNLLLSGVELPENLLSEVLRFIKLANERSLLETIAKSKVPAIVAFVLQHRPDLSQLTAAELALYETSDVFPEIVHKLITVDWKKQRGQWANPWNEFFSSFVAPNSAFPEYLGEHLIRSLNCTETQLVQLVGNPRLVTSARDYALLIARARELQPAGIGERMALALARVCVLSPVALKEVLRELTTGKLTEAAAISILGEIAPRNQARDRHCEAGCRNLGLNESVSASNLARRFAANADLLIGLARRPELPHDAILILLGHRVEDAFNDVVATTLECQRKNIVLNKGTAKSLTDMALGSPNQEADIIVGVQLAQLPSLMEHPEQLNRLVAKGDSLTQTQLAGRPDLPDRLRKTFMSSRSEQIVRACIAYETDADTLVALCHRDDRNLAAAATNLNLPQSLRQECLASENFHILRAFAKRNDLTPDEILTLIGKSELDVMYNIAKNPAVNLTPDLIRRLANFAQVAHDELLDWVPCLRLTVVNEDDMNDDEIVGQLNSYQSTIRLKLLERRVVPEDIAYEWTDDPDFAMTLGIIAFAPLSRRVVHAVLDNNANQELNVDRIAALITRAQSDIQAVAAPPVAGPAPTAAAQPPQPEAQPMDVDAAPAQQDADQATEEERAEQRRLTEPCPVSELLAALISHGDAAVAVTMLMCIPGGADSSAFAQAADGLPPSLAACVSQLGREALSDIDIRLGVLREMFRAHGKKPDIMLGVVSAVHNIVQNEPRYRTEPAFKSLVDNLLLDIIATPDITTTAVDIAINVASSSVLYHILNLTLLSDDALWSIFVRELITLGPAGPAQKKLAARAALPADLRWALALLQHSPEADAKENELLHILLQSSATIHPELIDFFLRNEPRETEFLLKSSHLGPSHIRYILDAIMPTNEGVRTYLGEFTQAVSRLCAREVMLSDLDVGRLTSAVIASAIQYARTGIELRLLPVFLSETLGLRVPTGDMATLLQALNLLFPPWAEEPAAEAAPTGEPDEVESDDEARRRRNAAPALAQRSETQEKISGRTMDYAQGPEAPPAQQNATPAVPADDDTPVETSLLVDSLEATRVQFARIVMSTPAAQFLPAFLSANLLRFTGGKAAPRAGPVMHELAMAVGLADAKGVWFASRKTVSASSRADLYAKLSALCNNGNPIRVTYWDKDFADYLELEHFEQLLANAPYKLRVHCVDAWNDGDQPPAPVTDTPVEEPPLAPSSVPLLCVPDEHAMLFGPTFAAAFNGRINTHLSLVLTPAVVQREVQLTAEHLLTLLDGKGVTVDSLNTIWRELKMPAGDDTAAPGLAMLSAAGLGECRVQDLTWVTGELRDITLQLAPQPDGRATAALCRDNVIAPILDATRVVNLPYSAVYRWALLFPAAVGKLPLKLAALVNLAYDPTDQRPCRLALQELDSVLTLVPLVGRPLIAALVEAVCDRASPLKIVDGRLSCSVALPVPGKPNETALRPVPIEALERSMWTAVTGLAKKLASSVKKVLDTIRSTTEGDEWVTLRLRHTPANELMVQRVLTLELLTGIQRAAARLEAAAPGSHATATTQDVAERLAALRDVTGATVVYARGHMRPCRHPSAVYRLCEFHNDGVLAQRPAVTGFLPALEATEHCVASVEAVWSNTLKPLREFKNLTERQVAEVRGAGFMFIENANDVATKAKAFHDRMYASRADAIRTITSCTDVTLMSEPDFTATTEETTFEPQAVPGLFLEQHPLLLDENLMPTLDANHQYVRDENAPKEWLPVMEAVASTRSAPVVRQNLNRALDSDAMFNTVPLFHIELLRKRVAEFTEAIEAAARAKYTTVSGPQLEMLIANFEKTLRQGMTITAPQGYRYDLIPKADMYKMAIGRLRMLTGEVIPDVAACLTEFTVTRRSSLAHELELYLGMLRTYVQERGYAKPGAAVSREATDARVVEMIIVQAIMAAEVSYHGLLGATGEVRDVMPAALAAIGSRLLRLERIRAQGSLLAAFQVSGSHVFFVSSHHDPATDQWTRFLHYNPNACASFDYLELRSLSPPADLRRGAVYEEVFSAGVVRIVLLSFTAQAIEQMRLSLQTDAMTALAEGDVHDESHLGRSLNLGRVNWARRSEGNVQIHHFRCEAALCNASPLMSLVVVPGERGVPGQLQMAVDFEALVRQTQELKVSWK